MSILPTPEANERSTQRRVVDRQIATLAIPALGALLAEPLFLLADTALVGHLGRYALSSVSVASTVLQTAVGLLIFLAYATTPIVARRFGAGDMRGALSAGIDGLWLAAGIGLCLTLIGIPTSGVVVRWFTNDPHIVSGAATYLAVSLIGIIPMLVVYAATGLLRGLQDTRTPLVIATIGCVVNFALNALGIYGLRLGVVGSAIGTTLTHWGMAAVYVTLILRRARQHHVSLRPHRAGVLTTAKDGGWLVIRTAGLRIALIMTVLVSAGLGAAILAGWQLLFTIFTAIALALDSLAIAAQALIGKSIGANAPHEASFVARRVQWWGLVFGCVVGMLLVLLHPWIGPLFTSDPAVLSILSFGLIMLGISMPIGGYAFALDGILMGASDMRFLAIAMLICLACFVPCLWIATLHAGENDVLAWLWAAFGIGMMGVRALLLALRTHGTHWMHYQPTK